MSNYYLLFLSPDIVQEYISSGQTRITLHHPATHLQVDDRIIPVRTSSEKKTILPIAYQITSVKMKQRCIQWSSEPFLKTVQSVALLGKATQVLLKHPMYSRFYRLYLQFQKRLKTTHNTDRYVTELAMRKVSELYEMWSVFLITRMAIDELLAANYQMVSNTTFYQVEKNAFQFDVHKNVASIVLKKENRRVEIKYEPIYPNQSTVTLRSALVATTIGSYPLTPDMAIEVYQDDQPQDVFIRDKREDSEKLPKAYQRSRRKL